MWWCNFFLFCTIKDVKTRISTRLYRRSWYRMYTQSVCTNMCWMFKLLYNTRGHCVARCYRRRVLLGSTSYVAFDRRRKYTTATTLLSVWSDLHFIYDWAALHLPWIAIIVLFSAFFLSTHVHKSPLIFAQNVGLAPWSIRKENCQNKSVQIISNSTETGRQLV